MNEIRQHIPNFVEHDESDVRISAFDTADGLLEIDWVKKWRDFPHFYRFSVTEGPPWHLMAEFSGGEEFWVVGRLREPVEGLPVWKHP